MSASRCVVVVAVQGEPGSYSEAAAFEYFSPEVGIRPCRTFAGLFDAVRQGQADFGVAPVENALGGSIHEVWDLLVEAPLPVAGEILLRVEHCLIGHSGVGLEELRRVYSHPQALAQCQDFLRRFPQLLPEEEYDTAGAVRAVKERGRREEAAIASAQAAADHGMAVLAAGIQTDHDNYTRFLVLGRQPGRSTGPQKTTVVLVLAEAARSLPAVLAGLAQRQLEVLKVETRKRLGCPWEYTVYLDFAGDAAGNAEAAALEEIRALAQAVHLVGSYPAGRSVRARLHRPPQ